MTKPKHSKNVKKENKKKKNKDSLPETNSVVYPENASLYKPKNVDIKQDHKSAKIFGIVLLVIFAIILVIYCAGIIIFNFLFFPNTSLSGKDISWKQQDVVAQNLNEDFSNFTINVHGSDLSFSIDAKSNNMTADTAKISEEAIKSQNTFLWPVYSFQQKDLTQFFSDNLNEGNLFNTVSENVDKVNGNRQSPENAKITWDSGKKSFVVKQEEYGTKIDPELVKTKIISAIINNSTDVTISNAEYLMPTIYSTDERFDSAIKKANELSKADFKIILGDTEAATVNGEKIQEWICMDDNFNITLDEDAASSWAKAIADGCNTVGTERTYTRADGKVVTVSGGTYGWEADGDGLAEKVIAGIKEGTTTDISIEASQTAEVLAEKGQKDWGNRYVDIDLTEQYARMYDKDGSLIWESDIVSGSPKDGDATPTGVYVCNNKKSPSTLKGPMKNGKPEWESKVQYWMPFIGNSIGLHDANWQSAFGGSRYLNGYGSHGCVNLPTGKAAAIYDLIQIGDVVVTHN